jgi:hypothetical protein
MKVPEFIKVQKHEKNWIYYRCSFDNHGLGQFSNPFAAEPSAGASATDGK